MDPYSDTDTADTRTRVVLFTLSGFIAVGQRTDREVEYDCTPYRVSQAVTVPSDDTNHK